MYKCLILRVCMRQPSVQPLDFSAGPLWLHRDKFLPRSTMHGHTSTILSRKRWQPSHYRQIFSHKHFLTIKHMPKYIQSIFKHCSQTQNHLRFKDKNFEIEMGRVKISNVLT